MLAVPIAPLFLNLETASQDVVHRTSRKPKPHELLSVVRWLARTFSCVSRTWQIADNLEERTFSEGVIYGCSHRFGSLRRVPWIDLVTNLANAVQDIRILSRRS